MIDYPRNKFKIMKEISMQLPVHPAYFKLYIFMQGLKYCYEGTPFSGPSITESTIDHYT